MELMPVDPRLGLESELEPPVTEVGLIPPRNWFAKLVITGFNLSGTLMTMFMSPACFACVTPRREEGDEEDEEGSLP